jgi:DNA-binding MarR family transcriptional regulator
LSPENQETAVFNDYNLWRLLDHTRFMIYRLRSMELDQAGLTAEQAHILDILSQSEDSISINQIVNITQRKHHSISVQIQRMSKQNLVTLKRDPLDSRKYEVEITKRGRTLLDEVSRDSIPVVFSCIPLEAKEHLRVYLKELLDKAYEMQKVVHQTPFKDE